jgi:hypothetical protein
MFIWGWRTATATLATVMFLCQKHGQPAAHHVYKRVTKFTLFFIPLFPINSKYLVECALCGETRQVSKEDAQQIVAGAEQPTHQH